MECSVTCVTWSAYGSARGMRGKVVICESEKSSTKKLKFRFLQLFPAHMHTGRTFISTFMLRSASSNAPTRVSKELGSLNRR